MDKDQIEVEVLLTEYKACREEMLKQLESAFVTTNITLAGIGVVFSIASFVIDANLTVIFAFFAIVFHVVTWIQLRFVLNVYKISNFLAQEIGPRIRNLFQKRSKKEYDYLLSWELYARKSPGDNKLWRFPIEAARYGLPLLVACTLSLTFILNMNKSGFIASINYSIIIVLVFLLIYSIYAILKTREVLRSEKQ